MLLLGLFYHKPLDFRIRIYLLAIAQKMCACQAHKIINELRNSYVCIISDWG